MHHDTRIIVSQIVPDASIADLRMHWDANRVMFTTLMGENDKRWNVYEVKLDGTGCKKLIEYKALFSVPSGFICITIRE